MRDFRWDLGPEDTLRLEIGWTGRKRLLHNGKLIQKFTGWKSPPVSLPGERQALVSFSMGRAPELRVNGEFARITMPGVQLTCVQCKASLQPYDKFCESCGAPSPPPEAQQAHQNVMVATQTIRTLAILFVIAGFLMAGLQYAQAQQALDNVAHLDAAAPWPNLVEGRQVTVGELRQMIEREPVEVLLLNLLLSAVMTGLYFWSKRAPLPAILLAAGTYLAIQVVSAIVDPATIAQGIVLKIIFVMLLYRGVQAALAQRSLEA